MKTLMKINDIINNYQPAYNDSWDNFFNYEGHSDRDIEDVRNLVERLKKELSESKTFDDPVILIEEYYDEDGLNPACVGDGMHRLVAHKELGYEDVHVKYGWSDSDNDDLDLRVDFITNDDHSDVSEDVFDRLNSLSFRHDGSHTSSWIQPTFGSGTTNEYELFFECKDARNVILQELHNDIQRIVGDHAVVQAVHRVEWDDAGEIVITDSYSASQ